MSVKVLEVLQGKDRTSCNDEPGASGSGLMKWKLVVREGNYTQVGQ